MRRTIGGCALALVLVATAQAQPARAPAPARLAETVAEARRMVHQDYHEKGYPGIAIAVAVGGEMVWSEGFGHADLEHRVPVWPTTKFRIGSISKPLTAAAVARLAAEGRLDVDAPIQRYVPDFPEKAWPLTTRHLGAHLGGIRHYRGMEFIIRDPYATVGEALKIFANDPLLHEPGTRYAYSSYGWNLISAVVEGAAGEPFLDYMRAHVFRPLGMHHTVADHVDSLIAQRAGFYMRDNNGTLVNGIYVNNSYKWAGGGFLSTVEDIVHFANAHLDDRFFSPEAKALLFTEQQTTAGEGVGYGFGWFVQTDSLGRRLWSHGGGSVGGTSLLQIAPDAGLVVVAMVNLSSADLAVVREVFDLFHHAVEPRQ